MILLRAPRTVRGRLLGLLLAASLPVLALAALGVQLSSREALREAERQVALERDHAVALSRSAIAAADAVLSTLALALGERPENCAALLEAGSRSDLRPLLVTRSGEVACGGPEAPAWIAQLRAGSGPLLLRGREPPAVLLAAQIPEGGGLVAAELPLAVSKAGAALWLRGPDETPQRLAGNLSSLPTDAAERVLDSNGTAWLAAAGGIAPGLTLVVARPEAPLRAVAQAMALRHFGEILAMLALGAVAVLLGTARAVTRPLAGLRAAAVRWRAGAPLEVPDSENLPEELRDVAEAFRSGAAALAARDAELSAAIDRAELLAEEVHHRVKNNLQIVSSLLALQAGRVSDPAARVEFEATRDRVAALATLHRHMYVHHDPEAIDLHAFLEELGAQLFAAVGERPGRRIALAVEAPPLRIASDQAVPLALLITEAVSSALKHGFPGSRDGHIAIRLTAADGRAHLVVEDDGAWPRADDRLRASLMRGFARQLGSELHADAGRLELSLPLRPPVPRERLRPRG